MWTLKHIANLAHSVAGDGFNDQALQKLVYCLKGPGQEVPGKLASVLIDSPFLWEADNPFSRRLAFGVLDNSLTFLDPTEQEKLLKIYQRQINLIRLCVLEFERIQEISLEGPAWTLERYETHFKQLRIASSAFGGLAKEEHMPKAVTAALLENVVVITEIQEELIARLLTHIVNRLQSHERFRLAKRVDESIEQGLKNPPVGEDTENELHFDLDEVRFRKGFIEDKTFKTTAERLAQMTAEICAGKSNIDEVQ